MTNNFKNKNWTKSGVPEAHVKQKRGVAKKSGVWDRMGNSKLKMKSNKQTPEKRKKVTDNRGKIPVKDANPTSTAKRTLTSRAKSSDTRCHMNVRLDMSIRDGSWFLNSSSHLKHTYHGSDEPDTMLLNETDTNDEQINYMRLMYESGVTNQTIANIMSNALNKNGTPGEFLASTIKNINENRKH